MEVEAASNEREKSFQLPSNDVHFCIYMMEKYKEDYKVNGAHELCCFVRDGCAETTSVSCVRHRSCEVHWYSLLQMTIPSFLAANRRFINFSQRCFVLGHV